jgi:curved DNA-binding protein CbpA
MDGSRARAVLGVSEHASADELRRAFRRLSLVTHPDHGGDADAFDDAVVALRVLERSVHDAAPRPVARPALVSARAGFDAYDSPRAPRHSTPTAPDFADVLRNAMAAVAA